MRYVIDRHAQSLGYAVEACETYAEAYECLQNQFQQFGSEFGGVMFGWPTTDQDDAAQFAKLLESSDHRDLPVVVLSTDLRADTRAWVAAREHCEILGWKSYQGLDGVLAKLIDAAPEDASQSEQSATVLNNDMHLLVVDDSATIRYSLRDLFKMQGYRITLASTHEEAMAAAQAQRFDIAILDFYLAETTGDTLCKELIASASTGEIVCTILTGTYSDHIIKRSLRAGAVECMFKNESSELLLSRIDAISRIVRQRRSLQSDHYLLEEVVGSVAGAVLIVGDNHQIELAPPGSQVHTGRWNVPDKETLQSTGIDIDYQHTLIEPSGFSLLRFTRRQVRIGADDVQILQQGDDPTSLVSSVIRHLSLRPESEPFLLQMQHYLANPDSIQPEGASLLMLEVFTLDEMGQPVSIESQDWLVSLITDTLQTAYQRDNHFTAFRADRFGFLLRHKQQSHAYAMTRKIMQLCLELTNDTDTSFSSGTDNSSGKKQFKGADNNDPTLYCSAAVISFAQNASQPLDLLVQHTLKGLELAKGREPNQALLMDLRRILSAYPTAEGSAVS